MSEINYQSGSLIRIFKNGSKIYTSLTRFYPNKKEVYPPEEGIFLEEKISDKLLSLLNDDVSLCIRFQKSMNLYRVYLERMVIQNNQLVNEEIVCGKGITIKDALLLLTNELQLERKR